MLTQKYWVRQNNECNTRTNEIEVHTPCGEERRNDGLPGTGQEEFTVISSFSKAPYEVWHDETSLDADRNNVEPPY